MAENIFNIAQSCSLVDVLAKKFSRIYADSPLELANVLFLLPNRRACVSLRDAFVRDNGLKPSILPQIVPIADADEDEIFLNGSANSEVLRQLPPAIDNYERLFLFTRLIISKPAEYGLPEMTFAQAFALAQDLAKLMDVFYNEQLSFDGLKNLVPEQYAVHWQETLNFLQIISKYWPQILQERGLCDMVNRKNALLKAQAEIWQNNKPSGQVVAAGITALFPGLKQLLKTIKNLPNGEIYFYGLDKQLEDEAWEQADESHPQYELKQLLEFLQISRFEVKDAVKPHNAAREKLVSEMMRPALSTLEWRSLSADSLPSEATENLHLITTEDMGQEASTIAVIMRDTLNTASKTAALVTTDRNLARRVAAELERWQIKIDDSAGKPLHLTPVGIYLRSILEVLEADFSDSSVLALLKSPFIRLNSDLASVRRRVRDYELALRTPAYSGIKKEIPEKLLQDVVLLKQTIRPLAELYANPQADFTALLQTHLQVAEALSGSKNGSGDKVLWRGDDGRKAAALFSKVLPQLKVLEQIDPKQYAAVLTRLMATETVRPLYGTHPRLKILGPIEARFNQYDVVIVGEVNEGVWPVLPSSDPWMSRPMKKDFGMPLPEKAIGVMAADFCQLMCAPEVYLTRAKRVTGTPMNKSRWLLRLETVLKAYGKEAETLLDYKYTSLARLQDTPAVQDKIVVPAPKPPIKSRPRRLSASWLERLICDPYSVFAAKILRLKQLDAPDKDLSFADYGNLIHGILEEFNTKFPQELPSDAREQLINIGLNKFQSAEISAELRAFWWPSFLKTVDWVLAQEAICRPDIKQIYNEVEGQMEFAAPAGPFIAEARADRLNFNKDGSIDIIDYKTGSIRSNKQVHAGYAPQLPIEGLIAASGGFSKNGRKIPTGKVNKLSYWRLGNKITEITETDKVLAQTRENLQKLISAFDFETTPYLARPNPKYVPKYSEYDHLERIKEWATEEDDE
ncbi:MAG: PD-(D/E)XK nuclease family protein [Alphaproteobacteria bacterium]|nr:PD-(D/E)XK nuclease family protein [Alphaproteobacteria bacterium]